MKYALFSTSILLVIVHRHFMLRNENPKTVTAVSLWEIDKAGQWPFIFIAMMFQVAAAYATYYEGLARFSVLDGVSQNNIDQINKWVISGSFYAVAGTIVFPTIARFIMESSTMAIKETVRQHHYTMLESIDLVMGTFQLGDKEITSAIASGANAVGSLISCITSLVRSIIMVCAVLRTIAIKVEFPMWITFTGLATILLIGILIQVSHYKKMRETNKATNSVDVLIMETADVISQDRFNGNAGDTVNTMSIYSNMKGRMHLILNKSSMFKFTFLECCIEGVIVLSTINFASAIGSDGDLTRIIIVQGLIATASWRMWGVFSAITHAQTLISEFASLQDFLEKYVPEKSYEKKKYIGLEHVLYGVSTDFHELDPMPPGTLVRLNGNSGCGKSVALGHTAIELKRYYPDVIVRCMEQTPAVTEAEKVTAMHWFLGSGATWEKNWEQINKICELATILGVQSKVSQKTMDKPFDHPSPGQKKRIMFIKLIFQACIADKLNGWVFLIDELLAGLDETSGKIAVNMLDELLHKGATILIIEHCEVHTTNKTHMLEVAICEEEKEILNNDVIIDIPIVSQPATQQKTIRKRIMALCNYLKAGKTYETKELKPPPKVNISTKID